MGDAGEGEGEGAGDGAGAGAGDGTGAGAGAGGQGAGEGAGGVSLGRLCAFEGLLARGGPFQSAGFEPDVGKTQRFLAEESKILVIGAGGLGCELLKNLALLGFRNIDVVDMDTIDYSNLNRQFLFRQRDVGRPKAVVAAEFVNARVPGARVVPHFGRLEDLDDEFYSEFNIVIAGLDSLPARRWINTMLVNMVEVDADGGIDPDTVIPFIDGGTEGFKGQARVILPRITPCFECTIDAFPPQVTYAQCTIAHTPRLPEHCIAWAHQLEWEHVRRGTPFDGDSPEHMLWVFEAAKRRAAEFGIDGVTLRLTQGVTKNIIPAIAATNAVIAAAQATEAFKIATNTHDYLNNYLMYTGDNGLYTFTFEYEMNPDCAVCGANLVDVEAGADMTLGDFIDVLREHPRLQLRKPSIRKPGVSFYMQHPPSLERATRPNLKRLLGELFDPDELLDVTDPSLPNIAVSVRVALAPPAQAADSPPSPAVAASAGNQVQTD